MLILQPSGIEEFRPQRKWPSLPFTVSGHRRRRQLVQNPFDNIYNTPSCILQYRKPSTYIYRMDSEVLNQKKHTNSKNMLCFGNGAKKCGLGQFYVMRDWWCYFRSGKEPGRKERREKVPFCKGTTRQRAPATSLSSHTHTHTDTHTQTHTHRHTHTDIHTRRHTHTDTTRQRAQEQHHYRSPLQQNWLFELLNMLNIILVSLLVLIRKPLEKDKYLITSISNHMFCSVDQCKSTTVKIHFWADFNDMVGRVIWWQSLKIDFAMFDTLHHVTRLLCWNSVILHLFKCF